ncbi:MAG: dihydroneopterin aldolase, partial [Lachnospiraceae bacterium]|nr:dihydroneopterin aldolase [Lachnospiraceae bacterium]
MDCITIKDLEVYCHHGVLKEENVLGQKFLVTAELITNIKRAAKTDDLAYSINY